MSLPAVRQLEPDAIPNGWLTVQELATATGLTQRAVRARVRSRVPEHARRKVRIGRSRMVVIDRRFVAGWAAYALANGKAAKLAGEFDPQAWDEKSIRRDALIRRILADADRYAAKRRGDGERRCSKADLEFCRQRGTGFYDLSFTAGTLRRWRAALRKGQAFPERRGRKRGSRTRPIGDKAAALFLSMYRRPDHTLRRAWEMVQAESAKYPGDPAWAWPSESTVRIWRKREHPDFYLSYYRKGPDHWRARYEPKLDRAPQDVPGNHTWELDGSKFNFFGQHRGRKVRFTYAIIVDVGTRMFVGHAVAVSESTELLVRALRRAALKYGAPKVIRADQGKANRGAAVGDANRRRRGIDWTEVTGIVSDIMADLQLMQGRAGWQKGSVESGVNIVSTGFDPLFGKAYIGRNHKNRVRGVDQWADAHLDELKTADEVDRSLGDWIDVQNHRVRRDMGCSPLEKFERTAIPFRKIPESVLNIRLLRAQRVKVTNRGVPIRVGGAVVYFGRSDPNVWERIGQELIARVADDDLGRVLLCDTGNRPLFYLQRDELRGVTSETLREIGKRKAKARKLRREHFANTDLAAAPTVDAAIQLQRESVEAKAARRQPADVPERDELILHTAFEAELKQAQRRELKAAVGAERVAPPPGPSLADIMNRSGPVDATDGGDGPVLDLTDIEFGDEVMEDSTDDVAFEQLMQGA